MTDKPATDWEAIEREYRAGQLSVSEIGRLHGVSHTAINKRAKRDSWTRNLAARVKEAVSAKLVSEGVSETSARETVEAAASRVVEVIRSHRNDITRGRNLARALFEELDEATVNRDEIEEAIEEETASDKTGKRRAAMLRAVALPSRASTLLALSSAVKNFIGLERQAFNIDAPESPGDDGAERRDVVDLSDEALAAIASRSRDGAAA